MMLALFSLSLAAVAAPPALRWDSGPVRYHGEMVVQANQPLEYPGWDNMEAQAIMHMLALDITCSGSPQGKGWDVECAIDAISLQATAYRPDEQSELTAIVNGYATRIKEAKIELKIGADGRINLVDLEGMDKSDQRRQAVYELSRELVRRALSPLDVPLPEEDVSKGDKWKHKGTPLVFDLLGSGGSTAGGMSVKYTAADASGSTLDVAMEGRGNVGPGTAFSGQGSTTLYNLTATGQARFDAAAGNWLYSEYITQGARSADATPDEYFQAAWIGRINADGTVNKPPERPE